MEDSEFGNGSLCNITKKYLPSLVLAMSATGGVGVLLAISILTALLCARTYKTVLQRLFICTVLTIIIHDSCHLANFLEYHQNSNGTVTEAGCAWLGFISNWSGWTLYIFYMDIILYLLGVMCVQVKGATLQTLMRSVKARIVIEIGIVTATIVSPALILWKPMHDQRYGLDCHGYCLLKSASSNFKYKSFYNFFGYEIVTFVGLCIALGLLITYCVLSAKLHRARIMLRHLAVLLTAIVITNVILNVMFVVHIKNLVSYKFLLFSAMFATVDDYIFLSGYLLVFHSSKLFIMIKKSVRTKKTANKAIHPINAKEYGTFKESDRVTMPSYTHFSIPYTGEFTTVKEQSTY